MMVTENQPTKSPIQESVRNIIGGINLSITLITIICMISAAIYLIYFENYQKSMCFAVIAIGCKYLFTIKKI